jgi:hypothetical protein
MVITLQTGGPPLVGFPSLLIQLPTFSAATVVTNRIASCSMSYKVNKKLLKRCPLELDIEHVVLISSAARGPHY